MQSTSKPTDPDYTLFRDEADCRHAEADDDGSPGCFLVELGQFAFSTGGAYLQAFDLAVPSLSLCFADPGGEVVWDLFQPGALLRNRPQERTSTQASMNLIPMVQSFFRRSSRTWALRVLEVQPRRRDLDPLVGGVGGGGLDGGFGRLEQIRDNAPIASPRPNSKARSAKPKACASA
ncbi:hypothetical protein IU459_27615 [Nocardia amamiensis]|uniref:Uncharacterized protein n=1 Tax=Nocardia amamiensis TaxID=404578 RepID=A0ABS0CXG8_9NOCA|nr:hypothetical protein [Nocardia amamiensis]MBF6301281.1 hypothetical protein [Nocardia amamiensis]